MYSHFTYVRYSPNTLDIAVYSRSMFFLASHRLAFVQEGREHTDTEAHRTDHTVADSPATLHTHTPKIKVDLVLKLQRFF